MKEEVSLLKNKVKHLKVLYTEDEYKMREITGDFLHKFFTLVDTAIDGQNGLEKFKNTKYDIVITDILMPNMDGVEMLKKMKEIDNKIFTIVLTASAPQEVDVKELSNLYYRKPITYQNMISIMEKLVEKFEL